MTSAVIEHLPVFSYQTGSAGNAVAFLLDSLKLLAELSPDRAFCESAVI